MASCALRFEQEPPGHDWWRGWLVSESGIQRLGADSIRVIAPRLADALIAPPGPQDGSEAHILRWALTLGNPHQPIYVYEDKGLLVLVVQSQHGAQMLEPRLVLDPATRADWVRRLRAVVQE